MIVAHDKLHGLDRDRILAVVAPVLRVHQVDGVELVWRTDRGVWVLGLTVERADSRIPGEGITIELCSDISRDLSAALDVVDVMPGHYRLEVGSPGLERALYSPTDYVRFAGQSAKLKLRAPLAGQHVVTGVLHGLDEEGRVLVETDRGEVSIEFATIESARLVFEWNKSAGARATRSITANRRAAGRGRSARRPQRSR